MAWKKKPKKPKTPKPDIVETTMSLGDHLEELRARILLALLGLGIGTIVGLIFGKQLFTIIMWPYYGMDPTPPKLVALGIPDAFTSYLKVSMIAGLILASPWVFYQMWAFVAAGLYKHERKYVYKSLPYSVVLFILGALFFLLVVARLSLRFFVKFSNWMDVDINWTLQKYVSFVTVLMLVFGVAFQTPIAIYILNVTGLVSIEVLKKARRVVFLVVFVVAAAATPPDVISQVMLGLPLYGLYEMGILAASLRRKKNALSKGRDDDDDGPGPSGPSGSGGDDSGGGSSGGSLPAGSSSAVETGEAQDADSQVSSSDAEVVSGEGGYGYGADDPRGGEGGGSDSGDGGAEKKSYGEELYSEENAYVDPAGAGEETAEQQESGEAKADDGEEQSGWQDPYGPGGEYYQDFGYGDYGQGGYSASGSYDEQAARDEAAKEIEQASQDDGLKEAEQTTEDDSGGEVDESGADDAAEKVEDAAGEQESGDVEVERVYEDGYPEPVYEGEPEWAEDDAGDSDVEDADGEYDTGSWDNGDVDAEPDAGDSEPDRTGS